MTHRTAASPYGSSPPGALASRLPSLTGARFIAAFLVFLFHCTVEYPLGDQGVFTTQLTLFGPGGFAGVTFFFVLSGFVLTWAMRPRDTASGFWRRRFFKIYPIHFLTFAVVAVLLLVFGSMEEQAMIADPTIGNAVLHVLLLQSWSPDFQTGMSFNMVSWSLSCEAFFYFAFPFVIKLIDKVRAERLWFWTILSGASVIAVPIFTGLVHGGTEFPGQGYTDLQLYFAFRLPPLQMLTFIFGMFLAKIVITGRRLPLRLGGAVALTVGAYFCVQLFPPLFQFSAVTVVPLGLLVAAAARADVEGTRTFLSSKAMVWLGNISFAYYMWHNIVLAYGHRLLGHGDDWNVPTAIGMTVLFAAVTVAFSWATFTFVELPSMRRFATSRRRRNLAAVTTVPAGPVVSTEATDRAA